MAQFLHEIERLHDGLNPSRGHLELARLTGFDPSFVEALTVSARIRGLLQPIQARGSRGRVALQISSRGRAWLAVHWRPDGQE